MRTSKITIIDRIQMKWYNDLRGDLWFGLKIGAMMSIPVFVSAAITVYFHVQRVS